MREVTFLRVVSCSSEDSAYSATNLLRCNVAAGKWRCKTGERNASVVLQLDRSVKIGQIDIGNNGSAFVEVLVGKSTASVNDFSVILPSSSFMSPAECKVSGGGNSSRVRMFGSDKLVKTAADDYWDLMKIVCTQPFNKTVPFGISFVKVYEFYSSIEAKVDESHCVSQPLAVEVKKILPVRDVKPTVISNTSVAVDVSNTFKRMAKRSSSPTPVVSESSPQPSKRSKGDSESASSKLDRPLKGVVFVLSGFQNPERGILRGKAIELGAKYEADWTDNCTHLVCAFANTPKFNQVKGKGNIVSKKWIEDCHSQKALLDWRKYDMVRKSHSSAHSDTTDEPRSASKPHAVDTSDAAGQFVHNLPDIFIDKNFYLDNSLSPTSKAKIDRLIISFGGSVVPKVSSATDYVVANDGADIASYEIDHPELILVRPDWILACQKKHKLLPHDQFILI